MKRLVLKFGGTSLASVAQIKNIAAKIKQEYDRGQQIIVVVSAISGTTNSLIDLCRQASPLHDSREYDTIVSTGEQTSAALLAISLQELQIPARSWLGWQVPIRTDDVHGNAHIQKIETALIEDRLALNEIVVVSGFQGLSDKNRITTLGRGGSDITAVALAAAFNADRCDIYTDVEGVYSADPRLVPNAQKLRSISHTEMLAFAEMGAKVLQPRSVELAMKHNVPVQVLSSFQSKIGSDFPGTMLVTHKKDKDISLSGIASQKGLFLLHINYTQKQASLISDFFEMVQVKKIKPFSIAEESKEKGHALKIIFLDAEYHQIQKIAEIVFKNQIDWKAQQGFHKVSLIGHELTKNQEVMARFLEILQEKQIKTHQYLFSDCKLSALIEQEYTELAVRCLHQAFELDKIKINLEIAKETESRK